MSTPPRSRSTKCSNYIETKNAAVNKFNRICFIEQEKFETMRRDQTDHLTHPTLPTTHTFGFTILGFALNLSRTDPLCNLQSHVHYSWSRLSRLWNISHFACDCHEILISNNWKKPGQAFSRYTYKNLCAKHIKKKTHICLAPSRHRPRSAPFALTCCAQMYAFYADTDESNNVNVISELITSKLQTAHCAAAHRGKRSPLRSITSCRRSGKWRTRSCTWNCELMCCAHAVKLRES